MKKINKVKIDVFHIILEPGDCTRYDFIIIQKGEEYIIAPYESTFLFPQKLDIYDALTITTLEESVDYITTHHDMELVNPHTLLQAAKTIVEINKNH